ncbi:unnamed protein product [Leuciscus chuanchicus]
MSMTSKSSSQSVSSEGQDASEDIGDERFIVFSVEPKVEPKAWLRARERWRVHHQRSRARSQACSGLETALPCPMGGSRRETFGCPQSPDIWSLQHNVSLERTVSVQ